MSLPAWANKETYSDYEAQLKEALSIACKGLEDIANHDQTKWDFERHTAIETMRRIEEMK